MSFQIKLPDDISTCIGLNSIETNSRTYESALLQLAKDYPSCSRIILNSSNKVRDTTICTIGDQFISANYEIPAGSIVTLRFIRVGG